MFIDETDTREEQVSDDDDEDNDNDRVSDDDIGDEMDECDTDTSSILSLDD